MYPFWAFETHLNPYPYEFFKNMLALEFPFNLIKIHEFWKCFRNKIPLFLKNFWVFKRTVT